MKHQTERILIFGAGGTLGQEAIRHINRVSPSVQVMVWDRQKIPLCSTESSELHFERFVRPELVSLAPDIVFNFAVAASEKDSVKVNVELPIWLAKVSSQLKFRLIHTSSVMVFSERIQGPYTPDAKADASQGYGMQKRLAEEGILTAKGEALGSPIIARIGWQIGPSSTQNTMRRFLELKAQQNSGLIRASGLWIPSCSRLKDTAQILWKLRNQQGGLYQIEGNVGLSFAEIARRLRIEYKTSHWKILETDEFCYNQLMSDERISMPPLFPR